MQFILAKYTLEDCIIGGLKPLRITRIKGLQHSTKDCGRQSYYSSMQVPSAYSTDTN